VTVARRATAPGGVVSASGNPYEANALVPYGGVWRSASCDRSPTSRATTHASSSQLAPPEIPLRTTITTYALEDAETALTDSGSGTFEGAAVLKAVRSLISVRVSVI